MWNGIPTGGLQESGVLHREHWNRCCHELDHEPHGWSRCVDSSDLSGSKDWSVSPLRSVFMSSSCDHLQTFLPPWCCRAAALDLEPRPQRAYLRSTWRPSSPWASAETRRPKHFEQRSESDYVDLEKRVWPNINAPSTHIFLKETFCGFSYILSHKVMNAGMKQPMYK